MELKTLVAQDGSGTLLKTAIAKVFLRGTTTLATNFVSPSDAPLSFPLSTDLNGMVQFKGPNGNYDLQFESNGKVGPKFAMQMLDPDLLSTDIKTAVKTDFSGPKGKSFIGFFNSFAQLRTVAPTANGDVVSVRSYIAGQGKGGGDFVGYLGTATDDGGFTAAGTVNGVSFYWRRADLNITNYTILEFGAMMDGTTDDGPAVKRMYEFMFGSIARSMSGSYSPVIGVVLPAGKCLIKPLDLTTYGNAVDPSNATQVDENPTGYLAAGDFAIRSKVTTYYGKQNGTTIISDKTAAPCLTIYHRRFQMHGIRWDGQQSVAVDRYNATTNPTGLNMLVGATKGIFNDTASNTQTFIKNLCHGGAYFNVTCFAAENIGGPALDFLDSIDARADQIYGSKTAAPVFQIGWSNQATGVWDHSTAFEITNFNFQECAAPALRIPRHGQGLMRNGWFEHGSCPADLNNGQWLLDAISIEDCRFNLCGWNMRHVTKQLSTPTGNKIDTTSPSDTANYPGYTTNPDGTAVTSWLSAYELGSVRIENFGSIFDSPVRAKWYSGQLRGVNNTGASIYVNVGKFNSLTADGEMWEVEVLSRNGYSVSAGLTPIADGTVGKTVIGIQRRNATTPNISVIHQGYSGVSQVQYETPLYQTVLPSLWLRIAAYSGYNITVKGSGNTRYEAGQPSSFEPSGVVQATNPNFNIVAPKFSFHNGTAGIGAQGSLLMELTTVQSINDYPIDTAGVYVTRKLINGLEVATRWWPFQPRISTQPTATVSVATAGTLTLSVVAADAYGYTWQKSTDMGVTWNPITGATAATYTKAAVVAGDAGRYRCLVRGAAYTIDNTNTTNMTTSGVSVVTVT